MQKVCINLANGRKINLNLYEEYAPITVKCFLRLVDCGYYNNSNLIFHRIIKGFMIQGGGYFVQNDQVVEKGQPGKIPGEFRSNFLANDILHKAGVISMARTSEFDSATNQFFICDSTCEFLDGQYAAFGIVADPESFDVVRSIASVKTTKVNDQLENFPEDYNDPTIIITSIERIKEEKEPEPVKEEEVTNEEIEPTNEDTTSEAQG